MIIITTTTTTATTTATDTSHTSNDNSSNNSARPGSRLSFIRSEGSRAVVTIINI